MWKLEVNIECFPQCLFTLPFENPKFSDLVRRAGPLSCLCLPSSGRAGAGYFTQLPHRFEQRSSCLFNSLLPSPSQPPVLAPTTCAGCFQRVGIFSSGGLFELEGQQALVHVVALEHYMTEKEKRALCEHRESSRSAGSLGPSLLIISWVPGARRSFDHCSLFRRITSR